MALRVLMLGWEYPPRISGGLGVACGGLVRALGRLVEVQLIVPEEATLGGGPYGGGSGLYGGEMAGKTGAFVGQVSAACRGREFDVIHAHDWMTMEAGLGLKARTGKPLVVHLHSLETDRSGAGSRGPVYELERRGMEAADVVVAVSGYTAGVCVREYGIERGKIAVVHNGVDAVPPAGGDAGAGENLVAFVGRLARQKGPEMFGRIAERVRERVPGSRFVAAGQGELEGALAGSGVELAGMLDRAEVFGLLRRARVFCMPSVSEPFGIAALEAALCGVPVVVSRQSGVREVLGAACLVDWWDERGWVEQVCRLLLDERIRDAAGQAVSAQARLCTWEAAAAKVLAVYRDWLGLV